MMLHLAGVGLTVSSLCDRYREYIKSRTPPTPRVNVKSPLWYIYENENTLAHKVDEQPTCRSVS